MEALEELLSLPPAHLAAALVVTFLAASIQGVLGLGFAVFSVPILSLLDARLAPVPQLLLTLPLTFSMAYRERHAIEWRAITWVLIGRIPGALLGLWLLMIATPRILDLLIGISVLLGVLVFSTRIQLRRNPFTELAAGIASGVGGLVSAIGGPPLALLYGNEKGETIRANLAAIFALGMLITIGTRLLAGRVKMIEAEAALLMLPGLLGGIAISNRLLGAVEGSALKWSVLTVCALAGAALLLRAMFGA
jgi:uncharacterized membrane protein YfcA